MGVALGAAVGVAGATALGVAVTVTVGAGAAGGCVIVTSTLGVGWVGAGETSLMVVLFLSMIVDLLSRMVSVALGVTTGGTVTVRLFRK